MQLFEVMDVVSKPVHVLVISGAEDEDVTQSTAGRILKAAAKFGLKNHLIYTRHAFIADSDIDKKLVTIHNHDGKGKKLTIDCRNTVAFVRGGAVENMAGLGLLRTLEMCGCFTVNSREVMELCRDKLLSAVLFEKKGIPSPRTSFVNGESSIDIALEKIGGKFPAIIKTITGSKGIGVVKVESKDSMVSALQAMWKYDAEVLIQEYIPLGYDVRTLVLDNEVIAVVRRNKVGEDFRTNVSLGAETQSYKLSKEEKEIVLKTSRLVGGYFVGIDHAVSNGQIYVLEANGGPGSAAEYYAAGKKISGDEMMSRVVKYVSDRNNWKPQLVELGLIEPIEVGKLGVLEGKLDTGNGGYNALHATNIDIRDGKVRFQTVDNKILRLPLQESREIHIGSGEVEDRPVVYLDTVFNGIKYKDVPYTLADRSKNKHPVLIGRDFMIKANVKVNLVKNMTLKPEIKEK